MSEFAYKEDETSTSSSGTPFHGFTKADATPAVCNPFPLIQPGVAVRQLQVESGPPSQTQQFLGNPGPFNCQPQPPLSWQLPPPSGRYLPPPVGRPQPPPLADEWHGPPEYVQQRWEDVDPDTGYGPQPAPPGLSVAAPLQVMGEWFPLLSGMPDMMMVNTDLNTLIAQHSLLCPDPRQDPTSAMEMWAAMATKFSAPASKEDESGVAMAKTIAALRDSPTGIAGG
jgi:hypothetical protein